MEVINFRRLAPVVIIALVVAGYVEFTFSSILKEKKELQAQFGELLKQKASLQDNLSRMISQLEAQNQRLKYMEAELLNTHKSLENKAVQEAMLKRDLDLARSELAALTIANKFLEKQSEDTAVSGKSLEDELSKAKAQLLEKDRERTSFRADAKLMNTKIALESENQELKKKIRDLETGLNLAREQQKKLKKDLNKAVTLNMSLQQNLVGLSQSVTSEEEEKEKAKELQNKVDVILMPQGSQEKKE